MNEQILYTYSKEDLEKLIHESIKSALKNHLAITPSKKTEFISRKKTAIMLGISLVTLNDYCKRGLIPTYRIGNRVLFIESEIIASVSKVKTIKHMRGEVDL